jgi:hypothetical protein
MGLRKDRGEDAAFTPTGNFKKERGTRGSRAQKEEYGVEM